MRIASRRSLAGWGGAALLAVTSLLGVRASGAVASHARAGGTLTVAWNQNPISIDPAVTGGYTALQLDRQEFDTLVWLTPAGKFTPYLATSWKISNGGKTYTFALRHGVKFQDGTPFNAAAVVANFTYIMAPSTHSQSAAAALGPYASSKALNQYTVQVNFKSPYPPFLARASQPQLGMQSPAGIKKYKSNPAAMPIGTGPFQFISFTQHSQIVTQRNPDYNWAPPALHHNGAPALDKIIYHIVETDQARVNELQTGQAQLADDVPGLYYKTFKGNPAYRELAVIPGGMPNSAIFNMQKFPTNDVAVRRAIMYSVDRKALIKFADSGQIAQSTGPLEQGTFGFDATLKGLYPYNPAKGAALLKADGWNKVHGIWTKGGKQLTLGLVSIANFDFPTEAQAFQRYMQKAGIVAKLQVLPGPAWQAAVVAGKYNVSVCWFYTDVDADVLRLVFTKGEFFNFSQYYDPTVNKLLIDASTQTDKLRRLRDYSEAQRMIMDQAAFIPIHLNADLVVMANNVKGVTSLPGGYMSLYTASLG